MKGTIPRTPPSDSTGSSTRSTMKTSAGETVLTPLVIAGDLNPGGTCHGASYADFYGSWNNVAVQVDSKITLKSSYQMYNAQSNSVILRSGKRCLYNDFYCFDEEDGDTYWDIIDTSTCSIYSLDVLYQGFATKYINHNISDLLLSDTTYFVEEENTLFALRAIKQLTQCGQIAYQTEHPRLFIIEDIVTSLDSTILFSSQNSGSCSHRP